MLREKPCETIKRSHTSSVNSHNHHDRLRPVLYLALLLLCLVSFDLFAGSDPLTRGIEGFIMWVKSGLGVAFASAVLIAIGVAWAFNKIHFGWVIGYCVGMGFIFGGQAIVSTIRGWLG